VIEKIKSWHGAPLSALRRAWACIGTLNDEAIPWDTRIKLLELLELYRRPLDSERAKSPADGETGNARKDDDHGAPEPSGTKRSRTKKRKTEEEEDDGGGEGEAQPRRSERVKKRKGNRYKEKKCISRMENVEEWLEDLRFYGNLSIPLSPDSVVGTRELLEPGEFLSGN